MCMIPLLHIVTNGGNICCGQRYRRACGRTGGRASEPMYIIGIEVGMWHAGAIQCVHFCLPVYQGVHVPLLPPYYFYVGRPIYKTKPPLAQCN